MLYKPLSQTPEKVVRNAFRRLSHPGNSKSLPVAPTFPHNGKNMNIIRSSQSLWWGYGSWRIPIPVKTTQPKSTKIRVGYVRPVTGNRSSVRMSAHFVGDCVSTRSTDAPEVAAAVFFSVPLLM